VPHLIGRLRNLVWPAKPVPPASRLVIYDDMFEDEEVLPASATDWCADQMKEIAAFASQHEAPDDAGWTDIYMRPEPPASIESLAIPYPAAIEALASRLPAFDEAIASGLNEPGWKPITGRAFGLPLSAVVVYHDEAARHVRDLAVMLRGDEAEVKMVLGALAAIPSSEPLMIVNWARARTAQLDRVDQLAAYARL
jgi:hypothetical protein